MYRVLCLSHPVAVELDGEWQSGADGRHVIENVLDKRGASIMADVLGDHASHDLVGGQYSYPLVSVYCPSHPYDPANPTTHRRSHQHGEWTDMDLLRLIWAAHQIGPQSLKEVTEPFRCWPVERLTPLRQHIDPSGKYWAYRQAVDARPKPAAETDPDADPGPATDTAEVTWDVDPDAVLDWIRSHGYQAAFMDPATPTLRLRAPVFFAREGDGKAEMAFNGDTLTWDGEKITVTRDPDRA
jgi:hypothetical protein